MVCTLTYAGFNTTYGAGYKTSIPNCIGLLSDANNLYATVTVAFDAADLNKSYWCTLYGNFASNISYQTAAAVVTSSPWTFIFPIYVFVTPVPGTYSITNVEVRTSADLSTPPICLGNPPPGDIYCGPLNIVSGGITYSCSTSGECQLNNIACTGTDNCYTTSNCDNKCIATIAGIPSNMVYIGVGALVLIMLMKR